MNQMTARAFYFEGQRFVVSGEGYGVKGLISHEAGEEAMPDLNPYLTASPKI